VVAAVAVCTGESAGLASPACIEAGGAAVMATCGAVMGDCGPGGGESPEGEATHEDAPRPATGGDDVAGTGGKSAAGDASAAGKATEDSSAANTANGAPAKHADTQSHAEHADAAEAAPDTPSKGTSSPRPSRTSGSSEGGCSFAPDTPVLMADGTAKPIGDLKPGDKVESADPATGKDKGSRTVVATWHNHDHDLADVTVDTGHGHTATLHTTSNHPFYDATAHQWVPAGKLTPGHTLTTADGHHVRIKKVTTTRGTAVRDNLTVQQLHTYYVLAGTVAVLVHNVCPTSAALRAAPHPSSVTFHSSADLTRKTASEAGSIQTVSGYASEVPDGFERAMPEDVHAALPVPVTPHPFMDNSGGPGAYYLSHAEKQASVLNPGYAISVSRDMCDDCISWFQQRAQQLGVTLYVSDPTAIHVFGPNGEWDSYDHPGWGG
jgi:hypothetical protein